MGMWGWCWLAGPSPEGTTTMRSTNSFSFLHLTCWFKAEGCGDTMSCKQVTFFFIIIIIFIIFLLLLLLPLLSFCFSLVCCPADFFFLFPPAWPSYLRLNRLPDCRTDYITPFHPLVTLRTPCVERNASFVHTSDFTLKHFQNLCLYFPEATGKVTQVFMGVFMVLVAD